MMPNYWFFWNETIIAHLAANGVTPEEFEAVVMEPEWTDVSLTSGRPIYGGLAADGRWLVCVYEQIDEMTILPVTAFEMEGE
jgi:hypothetical protein